jgi:putative Mn2+ efflux pump MntP
MTWWAVLAAVVLALGLSMDSAAAMAVRGLACAHVRLRDALLAALIVGGAHALTVTTGWLLGAAFGKPFEAVDHWIAFVLLVGLGIRSIVQAVRAGSAGDPLVSPSEAFAPKILLVIAIATAIDGLAAGVTAPLLGIPPGVTIAIITGVTATLAFAGAYAGRAIGARLGGRLGIVGGAALCLIGVKILVEHLG